VRTTQALTSTHGNGRSAIKLPATPCGRRVGCRCEQQPIRNFALMKPVLLLLVASTLAPLAVGIPASAEAAAAHVGRYGYVSCGDDSDSWNGSAGAFNIWARRTSCTTARSLGLRWSGRAWDEGFPRQVRGFRCRALEPNPHPTPGGVYIGKVLCTRDGGRRAVRFTNTI
jgi:hypothetical protein